MEDGRTVTSKSHSVRCLNRLRVAGPDGAVGLSLGGFPELWSEVFILLQEAQQRFLAVET